MLIPSRNRSAVVCCKGCQRNIPSGVEGMPAQPIVTRCLLCKEVRAYLPSEIFLGAPSYDLGKLLHWRK